MWPIRGVLAGRAAAGETGPGATLAIFTLLGSWNDLWPLIAINREELYTIQLGLANFQGAHRTQWQLLMAGNVVATLPLILFLVAHKQFVATMTFSGLKG